MLLDAIAAAPRRYTSPSSATPSLATPPACAAPCASGACTTRVTLLPSVPLEQLLAHTAEADVGVTLLQDTCENHRLALPNKLFEYIAARVPVIASALPETLALIEHHGVGWCTPPGDPAALADALALALRQHADPELRARLDRAAQELTWEREQQRLVELYAQLAASTARDHEAVCAQQWNPRQRSVQPPPRPAGQRGGERDRAHPHAPPQSRPQLPQANQARVGIGGRHPWLPDRDRPSGDEHPAGLAQGAADVLPRAHRR